MDAETLTQLENIRQNAISDNTRYTYRQSAVRFLMWLSEKFPNVMTREFIEAANELGGMSTRVIQELLSQQRIEPIKFDELTCEIFVAWIVSLRLSDDTMLSYSTFNGHRSALCNLFREYRKIMSTTLASDLTEHYRSLKKLHVGAMVNSEKVGKDHLPFSMYKHLCKVFLQQHSKEFVFAHSFMVICWNLMCRAAKAVAIKFEHMEWSEDSLCIYFAKNDQCGERPREPRHVYPNPLMPEICPILSLGIYWLTYSFSDTNSLFPGNNQYDRFRKILKRTTALGPIANELDIGTDSMRKGAAAYCFSGSTAGPSSTAIHLRAGWAMGGVQDLRYEEVGDMYVGRFVSGLPVNQPEFDTVGPRFKESATRVLSEYVPRVFPNLPASLGPIAEHALACLVYHKDFITDTLPESHPVRQSILFRDRLLFNTLRPWVVCSLEGEVQVSSTGVPPHVSLLRSLKTVQNELMGIMPAMADLGHNIVRDISTMLEERANSDTAQGMRTMLEELPTVPRPSVVGQVAPLSPQVEAEVASFHWTENGIHRLPENYKLPNGTVSAAFRCWMLPDTENRACALRYCSPSDFVSRNDKKRFSDLSKLMSMIQNGNTNRNISIEEVDRMVEEWQESAPIPNKTPKGRPRRKGQLKWTSVLKILTREN